MAKGATGRVNGSIAAMPLATGVPLVALSIAVLTVSLDRGRWWVQWWRSRNSRSQRLLRLRREAGASARQRDEWNREMRFGEPFLEAAIVLSPLLGLTGTVLALMGVLASLGPDLTLPAGASLHGYGQVLMSTLVGLMVSLIASATLLTNRGLRSWQLERLDRLERRLEAAPGGGAATPGGAESLP
jgi:biopolymer transport protein ExbB